MGLSLVVRGVYAVFVRILLCTCLLMTSAHAQEAQPLYSGAIPGAIEAPDEESLRDPKDAHPFYLNISRPKIYPYLLPASSSKRSAVVILPGGGYRGVSILKEGFDVATQLNQYGVVAFVVRYRTPSDRHMQDKSIGPLQDAQQAIRWVRSQADRFGIDAKRVGLMGFSAGGHLAATAATHFKDPVLPGAKASDVKPDFLMLLYPVITFQDPAAHAGSREMLLGKQPTAAQIARFSAERHVSANTPPTFIVHAADDQSVPVANSLRFFEAVNAKGVAAELIVYPAGGHGFGLNNGTTPDRWIERLRDWLVSQKLVESGKP